MFQPARGTNDFLPQEMRKRNWVLDNFREVFETYGYEPLGTPAFESWDMLKIKSGEDAINQIYYFKDKSNRELGLRFEWTASLARVVASHRDLPMPFKRYAIGPVWRYERPSEKSRREFWQMDVDVVGVADPVADTEVLAVAVHSLERIGFERFLIRLNDRRLLEALVKVAELPKDRLLDIFRAIDKRDKIGDDEVKKELKKIGATNSSINNFLDLTSIKGEPRTILEESKRNLKNSSLGDAACYMLSSIIEYSANYGIDNYIEIDLGLARGLDYYTGPVFEVYAKDFREFGSIAGGGRYDELVQLFGGDPTPMTGISMGIERIVPLLEKKGKFKELEMGINVLVVSASKNLLHESIKVAQMLRQANILTEMDLLNRSLRKQLDIANSRGIKKVVIIGKKEMKKNCVIIRDMVNSTQKTVKLNCLINEISNVY